MSFRPVLIVCLLLAPSLPALAAGPRSIPAESFLNYHVSTLGGLTQEVTVDPVVRGRLARHFHVSDAQMSAYIQRNLTLTHLSAAGTYRVACVRPNGQEYWVQSRLPAGTAVFASRATGRPILKLACGNPMTASLPPAPTPAPMAPPQVAALPRDLQMASIASPTLLPSDLAAGELDTLVTPIVPDTPVVLTSPSLESLIGPSNHVTSLLPALLGAAGTVATLGGLHSSHSGSPSSGGGTKTPGGGGGPAPVPEASTSLLMAVMLALGGTLLLRRKRSA